MLASLPQSEGELLVPYTVLSTSYGLSVAMHKALGEMVFDKGGAQITIPKDTIIGELAFHPFGRTLKENRTHAILAGYKGLNIFFNFLEAHCGQTPIPVPVNIEPPQYLVGATNERMAKFATKVGFTIVEEDKEHNRFALVGETQVVQEQFRQFMDSMKPAVRERLTKEAMRSNPDYWRNSVEGVEVVQGMMPNSAMLQEVLQEVLQRDIARLQRHTRYLRAGVIAMSGLNLCFAANSFINGNYAGAAINGGIGLATLASDQIMNKARKKRTYNS